MTTRFFALFIACLTLIPQFAEAGTAYSTFKSDHTYTCCAGVEVAGPAATNAGVLLGQQQTAGGFTPTENFDLTQIDVAFWTGSNFPPDNDTNGFTLSLNQNAAGVLGVIESWTGLTACTAIPLH